MTRGRRNSHSSSFGASVGGGSLAHRLWLTGFSLRDVVRQGVHRAEGLWCFPERCGGLGGDHLAGRGSV